LGTPDVRVRSSPSVATAAGQELPQRRPSSQGSVNGSGLGSRPGSANGAPLPSPSNRSLAAGERPGSASNGKALPGRPPSGLQASKRRPIPRSLKTNGTSVTPPTLRTGSSEALILDDANSDAEKMGSPDLE
ncbi:unnamed protein product, partial [Polarella glacialis]